ncbi:MAG TPA: TlpA disulfide reductase family protein [Fimbriimonas sp.]|nr:TlpA disulfide reductase family protein [Fimbriimonas sp.]
MLIKFVKPVIALTLVSAVALSMSQGGDPQALKGKPLPTLKMKDLAGKTITNSTLKGKVVLLDFWATWCGPCKAASPFMQSLHTKYAKSGLMVIGANVLEFSPEAKKSGASDYKKEHKYTYTFTTGADDFVRKAGFSGIPAFVYVDRAGVVREVQMGYGEGAKAKMESTIKQLLAKK